MEEKRGNIKAEIKEFIIRNYLRGDKGSKLGDNDSFLELGIIDSIGVIELTGFIRERYNINIEVTEIVPENFDTLNNLEKYITGKLRGK